MSRASAPATGRCRVLGALVAAIVTTGSPAVGRSAGLDGALGETLYARHCAVCHGEQGNGRSRAARSFYPPPRDFTAAGARTELARARMIFSVTHGRPNTAMAPWGAQLSQAEIETVVDYVREAFMRAAPGHAPMPDDAHSGHRHRHASSEAELAAFLGAPFASGLSGDPEWGRRFYQDNCASCHGVDGQGQGPRAYFILPKPRTFGHPAARRSLNRPHLYEAIAKGSRGTVMSAWDKVLSPQEIANVAEYVFQAFIAPRVTPR